MSQRGVQWVPRAKDNFRYRALRNLLEAAHATWLPGFEPKGVASHGTASA